LKTALALTILFFGFAAHADQTATDMATLLSNSEVQAYLDSGKAGTLISVEATGASRCPNAPGIFSINTVSYETGKQVSCSQMVMVGLCSTTERTAVSFAGGPNCQ
jgi:hypothetical protein